MTKTKTPTYEVTAWYDIAYAVEHHGVESEPTLRGVVPIPRCTGPTGVEFVQFQYSYCDLTTDDLHRELDAFARNEHKEWEDRSVAYTGLIGHGDGWWHCSGAELWYHVAKK